MVPTVGKWGAAPRTSVPGTRALRFGLPVLAVLAAAVLVAHVTVIPPFEDRWGILGGFLDVGVYRGGGLALLHGDSVYLEPVHQGMYFTYTPFAALVFAPLAALPLALVEVMWSAAVLAALVLVVVLCVRQLGHRVTGRVWLLAVLAAAVSTYLEPVRTTFNYGQINVFLMLLILWDLGRPAGARLRGVGVGLAAGIKLTPAFFFVHLLVTRQFRACVVAVATLVGTVAVSLLLLPRDTLRYFTGTVLDTDRIGVAASPPNQSVSGALANTLETAHPPFALWLACSAVVGLAGLAAVVLAHRAGHTLFAVGLAGLTACALSPFSWGHHWVWWLPVLVVLVNAALVSGRWHVWVAPVAVVAATLAWSHRFAPDFVGIGLFMLLPGPPLENLAQSVYVVTYALVVAGTLVYYLAARRRRAAAG